jgi:choline dehydrogenase-like flavoprotein
MSHRLQCDFLIIGSGAAGGVLAGTLSELTNKKIILVEKGGFYPKEFFNQNEIPMVKALYTSANQRNAANSGIPVRGGECVGGGTTINIALCLDPVESVWQRWKQDYNLREYNFFPSSSDYGISDLNMANSLKHVRQRCSVDAPNDDQINDNNKLFLKGCKNLGISVQKFDLNMKGCIGCGYCDIGCAYDAKQGTMITYIRDAIDRGVKVVHHCEVEEIKISDDGRKTAVGIIGNVREVAKGSLPLGIPPGKIDIDAKVVIVAAGAVESPVLLQKSQVPDPHSLIGKGLVLHPSLPIVGLQTKKITNYRGVTGCYFSKHFYDSHGFYLECLFGLPTYAAVVLPFFGKQHFSILRQYDKMNGFGVMMVDEVSQSNRVEWDPIEEQIKICYELSSSDKQRLLFAAEKSLHLMFATGAKNAFIPSEENLDGFGAPFFSNAGQIEHIKKLKLTPQTTITSAHPQASVKMSENTTRGVINSRCESHYVKNLLVCDSSSFPTSCGANPMVSIMTMARYQGVRIASELKRYF